MSGWALSIRVASTLLPAASPFWVSFGIKVLFEVTRQTCISVGPVLGPRRLAAK